MGEEIIEQVLSSALANLESSSNSEMMLMNDDDESIDPDLIEMIQQQSIVPTTSSSVVVSSIEEIPTTGDDDDLFVEDETTLERIIALKEMFPETIRNTLGTINSTLLNTSKLAYDKGRSAAWWITSSMCVLVFPILIQKELLQIAEQISHEQRSILLGPQAATSALSGSAF
ncbi:unnamed protein product [Rotaria magnacalcarata]|uniref:Mitochondrial import receptor subunit TOM22 homolog n=1 Tax=Rotaria magnacalcarata TaxID=392030 RepID=A0A816W654_9BILA|nr:unnamed protein product [Rotaria magnacalcarata]CAF2129098.1 unnamed protein product [Rotaria magnacalcarata]CAF4281758.1 unnamed protein product [Rotaria magnacalcarata]CAF4300986.1 unnamed protein product [Rotaria magnacalcarata]